MDVITYSVQGVFFSPLDSVTVGKCNISHYLVNTIINIAFVVFIPHTHQQDMCKQSLQQKWAETWRRVQGINTEGHSHKLPKNGMARLDNWKDGTHEKTLPKSVGVRLLKLCIMHCI